MNKFQNKLSSFLVLPLIVTNLTLTQPEQPEVKIYNPTPQEAIVRYSSEYGISPDLLYSVLFCESGVNPNVKNGDSGHSKGIGQIKDPTFESLEKQIGEDLDRISYSDNIKAVAFGISSGQGNLWTAYRAIKNDGSYTFINSHTKKEQTVYCKLQKMPV